MRLQWIRQLSDIMHTSPSIDADSRNASAEPGFDDAALIAQVRTNGSTTHFRLLIQRHQKHVYDLVASVLGPLHRQLAEETAQDVFLKIFQKLDSFRGDAQFSTWAYRLAYNTALDRLRALRRQRHEAPWSDACENLPAAESEPPNVVADLERQEQVRSAVEQLPELYRSLIHLHYWRGLTIVEISNLMASRPGTIKSYLHRARGRLADLLGESG